MILDSRSSSVFGALAILAPMAGTRVMAVGAIGGRPSPLGDNALWQPHNCPPLPHLAGQQMHCGRSHRPWVVDTSLTARSTVSTLSFIQSEAQMREAKSKNFINFLSFLIAYHKSGRRSAIGY